jgi:mycothiol synthase
VTSHPVHVRPELDATTREAVLRLAEAAHRADGVAPLNEHTLLHLDDPAGARRHVLALAGDQVVGYAFVDPGDDAVGAEVVVEPASRGHRWGRALVAAALAEAGDRALEVWAHGDLPAAAAVAGHTGLRRVRELRRMSRPLADPLPDVVVPDGVRIRTYADGTDDEAWVDLNARAFASHPEQGAMTVADLRARREQSWYDPAGFFVAERDGTMVGFHWTKVHGDEEPPLGEVYVVGVDPGAQGGGLGRALTLRGLHHLREAGLGSVLLYVEADNAPALRVYEGLGFTTAGVDVQYRS